MPSRELTYRVNIDTGTARREAQNVRRSIEAELRNIRTGDVNVGGLDRAAGSANQAGKNFGAALVGGIGAYLTVNLAQTLERTAREFAEGNTEIKRANAAFVELAGGAQQAQASLISVQQGAAGAISQFEAIKIVNQAAALGLAETGDQFKRLTEAARVTALISPVINDVSSAISELGLASANLSYRRLDQLGLSVTEVRDRMRELQQANGDLTDSQAFLEASVDSLIGKGRGLLDSQAAQASGVERFNVAINEFLDQEGAFSNALEDIYGNLADVINEIFTVTNLGSDKTIFDFVNAEVAKIESQLRDKKPSDLIPFEFEEPGLRDALDGYKQLQAALRASNQDIIDGVVGALDYRSALREIVVSLERGVIGHDEIAGAIRGAREEYERYQEAIAATTGADAILTRDTTRAFEEQQRKDQIAAQILEAQSGIDEALLNRATDAAAIVGVERAISTLKEQKALVDAAITELINSGITDPAELSIRLAEIENQVLGFFDSVEAQAQAIDINFGDLALATDQFNVDFVDFLPGMDELRDRLIDLQNELAFTGSLTADQAAELDYLMGAASAAGGEAAMLADVTNDLGTEFLATNQEAAELLDQMYLATAAYLAGEIGAEAYAGVISALGGELNSMATDAGVATGALATLLSVYSKFTGQEFDLGFTQGTSIVNRVNTRDEERARRQARVDAERAARDAQRAQERAARESQRAFEKAARETQKAFEEAARQLESDLRAVPGLFSPTSVTGDDFALTEAGIYTDQADEYLRRLRDEVLNGTDWADVSIEDAKQSLRDLGINVADDNEIALKQFTDAWANQVLFSDAENIAKYINDEAVQASLDLQEKARQGQENILAHFGVVVDEAIDAVVTGAGGSYSGSGVATVPVQAQLIPANGDLTSIPTLGGESFVLDVAAIQGQIDALDVSITPTLNIDDANFAEYEQIIKDGINPQITAVVSTFGVDVAALGQVDIAGKGIAERLKQAIANTAAETAWVDGEISAPIATGLVTAINTQIRGTTEDFKREGYGISAAILAGVAAGWKQVNSEGQAVNSIATGLVQETARQFDESQNLFYATGAIPAGAVLSGYQNSFTVTTADGTVKSALATGMLDSLTQGIRVNAANFQQRGQSVAEYMKAGFLNQFASDTFAANIEAAGGLMAGYLKQGILSNLNGVADAIASAVIDDITATVEAE